MQKMQAKINQLGILFCTIFFLTSQPLLGEEIPLLKSPKVDNPKSVAHLRNLHLQGSILPFIQNDKRHNPFVHMH